MSARVRSRAARPAKRFATRLAGKLPLKKLFSKAQRAFYAEHAPVGIDLDDSRLRSGPRSSSREPSRRLSWIAVSPPSTGSIRTDHASSSCRRSARRRRPSRWPRRRGPSWYPRASSLSGSQQTKTRTALEFFQKQLAEAAKPAAHAASQPRPERQPSQPRLERQPSQPPDG